MQSSVPFILRPLSQPWCAAVVASDAGCNATRFLRRAIALVTMISARGLPFYPLMQAVRACSGEHTNRRFHCFFIGETISLAALMLGAQLENFGYVGMQHVAAVLDVLIQERNAVC